MLGKLIKYEFRATRRIFLPLYGLILLFAAINRFFIALNYNKADSPASVSITITIFIYALLVAASFIMTLVVMIQRFQRNLLGDEGYLSFTLPVKVHSHITAKLIVSLVWVLLSMLVCPLSLFIIAFDTKMMQYNGSFLDLMREIGQYFGRLAGRDYLVLAEGIVLFLVTILTGTLQVYASVTVGNYCPKHRLLAAFGVFLGFCVLETTVASFLSNAGIATAAYLLWGYAKATNVFAEFGYAILISALFGTGFYALTNWLLSKKLNLE